jgi:hypothetical protein
MWTLHPSYTHVLRWSLMCSVKQTWTGSAFSTNESAQSAMVTGSQSRVQSGPKLSQVYLEICGNPFDPFGKGHVAFGRAI